MLEYVNALLEEYNSDNGLYRVNKMKGTLNPKNNGN